MNQDSSWILSVVRAIENFSRALLAVLYRMIAALGQWLAQTARRIAKLVKRAAKYLWKLHFGPERMLKGQY